MSKHRKRKMRIIKFAIALSVFFFAFILAGEKKLDYEITLKWNKAYSKDDLAKNVIGLKWCLLFLGSSIAADSTLRGISHGDSIIFLDVAKLGFHKKASEHLAHLNYQLKQTGEYKETNAVDLGRYMALTIGSPYHYYKITGTPNHLDSLKARYTFDSISGYIDNSGVSLVDRVISFSPSDSGKSQAFISSEKDPDTKEIYEFETVELMPNGLVKFGIYDKNGVIKDAADPMVTRAGKPAKCMWCHESVLQPVFRKQNNYPGHLSSNAFRDSLDRYSRQLRRYQDSIWKDANIKNRRLHTLMEIAYIGFMEPSVERLSGEWGLPVPEVVKKVSHLQSHRHDEFNYLGDLYHRKDVDVLAPWSVMEVPERIREKSANEMDHLTD